MESWLKKTLIVIASIILIILIIFIAFVLNGMNSVYFDGKDFQYKGKYKEAIECFTEAIEEDGIFKTNAYLHRGQVYAKIKEFEKSLADFDSAFFESPQNYSALNNKSDTYLLMDEFENALMLINRSINVESTDEAHIIKGKILWKMGDLDNAEKEYEIAIQFDSSYYFPYFKRAFFYSQNHEFEKSIADLTISIELDSEYSRSYNNRGWSYLSLGDYDKALIDIQKSISLDSTNAFTYHSLATLYFKINDNDNELDALNNYLIYKTGEEPHPLDSITSRIEELKNY